MDKTLANNFINKIQEIYYTYKKHLTLNIRGESAVLAFLCFNKNEVTPGILSSELGVTTSRIAASLNSLENKGHIKRDISLKDRRKIIITLTDKGEKEAHKIKEFHINSIAFILTQFNNEDIKEIMRLTNKFEEILKIIDEKEDK